MQVPTFRFLSEPSARRLQTLNDGQLMQQQLLCHMCQPTRWEPSVPARIHLILLQHGMPADHHHNLYEVCRPHKATNLHLSSNTLKKSHCLLPPESGQRESAKLSKHDVAAGGGVQS
jgi:hypothetical protein